MTAITVILTCVSFLVFNYIFQNISNAYSEKHNEEVNEITMEPKKDHISSINKIEVKPKEGKNKTITQEISNPVVITNVKAKPKAKKVWQLKIPKINLTAPVSSRNNSKSNGQRCRTF